MNTLPSGNPAIGAPGSLKRLEAEAKDAHDRGDYYTWGKIQAELDRLYLSGKFKPIEGCKCYTCKRLRGEQGYASLLCSALVVVLVTVFLVLPLIHSAVERVLGAL